MPNPGNFTPEVGRSSRPMTNELEWVRIMWVWSPLFAEYLICNMCHFDFSDQEDVREQTSVPPLNIVILGHRAEDPASMLQDIELISCLIILWILGTAPEDDDPRKSEFPQAVAAFSVSKIAVSKLSTIRRLLNKSRHLKNIFDDLLRYRQSSVG